MPLDAIQAADIRDSRCVKFNRFSGKNVIVTGGSSGIGRSTARQFAMEGASVAIMDIDVKKGSSLARALTSEGFKVAYYNVDVSKRDICQFAVQDFVRKNGGYLNVLVNCAVYFGSCGLNATPADFEKSFGVNCIGTANMTIACHPFLKEGSRRNNMNNELSGASVIHISSISAHISQPCRWTYSATKGALAIMTKTMALDMSADNIRVNCVSPAWIWTPEVEKAANADGGGKTKWNPVWGQFHMLRRCGEPHEVARVILFLASEDASFITGTDVPIDGGYMSMGPEGLGLNSKFAGSSSKL